MIKDNVCSECGAEIEKDRRAIVDTPLCAACAAKNPGNILQDQRQKFEDPEVLANELYTLYCAHVGGLAHDGKPLPTWAEFYSDANKRLQSTGWVAIAARAIGALRPLQPRQPIVRAEEV